MKLYFHPVSTTCRTIMLFASEANIPLDYQLVDLMTGEHLKPEYRAINPNALVPVLEDGDFRLTESSAILKYLADKVGSPAYPKDLRERARVNEMMDWVNANLYRDLAYGICYPQLFAHHKRPSDVLQAGTIAWGQDKARVWLGILDKDLLGSSKKFLCGNTPTIADYFAAPIVTLCDLIRADLGAYPNIRRWLTNVKALPSWGKVNEAFDGYASAIKDQPFLTP
jgi:glutathione S-transferase